MPFCFQFFLLLGNSRPQVRLRFTDNMHIFIGSGNVLKFINCAQYILVRHFGGRCRYLKYIPHLKLIILCGTECQLQLCLLNHIFTTCRYSNFIRK